jgi:hypothetical protein
MQLVAVWALGATIMMIALLSSTLPSGRCLAAVPEGQFGWLQNRTLLGTCVYIHQVGIAVLVVVFIFSVVAVRKFVTRSER